MTYIILTVHCDIRHLIREVIVVRQRTPAHHSLPKEKMMELWLGAGSRITDLLDPKSAAFSVPR